jgi:hypothetical protein
MTIVMNKLSHDVTLEFTVKLSKEFRIRYWMAVNLIKLATIILGCGLEINHE